MSGGAAERRIGEDEPGIRFRAETSLAARALSLIREEPRTSAELARQVLGVRRSPPELTERLARELLRGDPRVRVDAKGMWRLRRRGRPAPRRLDELAYAVVDVETTGGGPRNGGRIVEVAIVQVRGGRIAGEFSSLVNPGIPIQPWVRRLTGIHDGDVAGAPRFAQLERRVRRELEGRVFVAHNAGFDWRFLSEEIRRAGGPPPGGPRLCTMRLARRALPGLERRGLDALAAYYGIEIRPRHRAAADAIATARLLLRLLEQASRQGVEAWDELQAWLRGARRGAGREDPGGVEDVDDEAC